MQTARYSGPARFIHWLMAGLILITIPAGLIMVQPGIDRALQNALFLYHKNVGVLLAVLVVLRLLWRWRNPPPPRPMALAPLQARIAGLTHGALYLLMVVVPIAGYVRVRAGGFPIEVLDTLGAPALVPRSDTLAEIAQSIHYGAGLAMAALIALHIAAACFHGVLKRDGVFSRMWPPFGG